MNFHDWISKTRCSIYEDDHSERLRWDAKVDYDRVLELEICHGRKRWSLKKLTTTDYPRYFEGEPVDISVLELWRRCRLVRSRKGSVSMSLSISYTIATLKQTLNRNDVRNDGDVSHVSDDCHDDQGSWTYHTIWLGTLNNDREKQKSWRSLFMSVCMKRTTDKRRDPFLEELSSQLMKTWIFWKMRQWRTTLLIKRQESKCAENTYHVYRRDGQIEVHRPPINSSASDGWDMNSYTFTERQFSKRKLIPNWYACMIGMTLIWQFQDMKCKMKKNIIKDCIWDGNFLQRNTMTFHKRLIKYLWIFTKKHVRESIRTIYNYSSRRSASTYACFTFGWTSETIYKDKIHKLSTTNCYVINHIICFDDTDDDVIFVFTGIDKLLASNAVTYDVTSTSLTERIYVTLISDTLDHFFVANTVHSTHLIQHSFYSFLPSSPQNLWSRSTESVRRRNRWIRSREKLS